ncbi:MAG: hypothetical protein GY854_28105 [Deltaproteobacteria bacterium]|nr:hypothetical protein [Deltaproteobacteria bacterium]
MKHPVSIDQLPPKVADICGPDTPAKRKHMAADGLFPLGPTELVTALYVLSFDESKPIAAKAIKSINGMPEGVLFGAIEQIDNEYVLDGIAHHLVRNEGALEKTLLNQALADETAHWIAANSTSELLLEIIAANETRLLRYPTIIEALYNNGSTRMSTADRTVELAVRNNLELTGIATFQEVKAALMGELIVEATEEPTPDDMAFNDNMERDEWMEFDDEEVEEILEAREAGIEEDSETSRKVESVEQSLARLNVTAKIRTATLGSSTQRSILIRDSNKLVIMACIKSPGVRDSEAVQFSKYRSLPEEAMRFIGSNRDWTKHYQIKMNLVQNPRTPMDLAMRFLPHLRANDIRGLERDKNIPQAVANAAKRLRAQRTK